MAMTTPLQPGREWHNLVYALLVVYFGALLWQTPEAYRDISERNMLDRMGAETLGKVVSLHPPTRRNKCTSSAVIQYQIGHVPYQVGAAGCGAAPDGGLQVGAEVRVIYVPDSPGVAQAVVPGVQTNRASWSSLVTSWLGFVLTAALALAWLATRSKRPTHAA